LTGLPGDATHARGATSGTNEGTTTETAPLATTDARRGLLELPRRGGHLYVPVSCYELAPGVEDDDASEGEDEDECDAGSCHVEECGQPAHRSKSASDR
jgi:hypothetical protein